jgi:TolB-like protein
VLSNVLNRCLALVLALLLVAPGDALALSPSSAPSLAQTHDGEILLAKRRRRKRRKRRKKKAKAKKVKPAAEADAKPPVAERAKAEKAAATEVRPEPKKKAVQPPVTEAEEKPGLAVMAMDAQVGLPAGVADLLNETLLSQINDTGRFSSVLSSSDMQAMLDLEVQKAAMGCDQDSCMAELGGALGVPYMLIPSVAAFGGRFIVNMKLVAVDESKVAARISKTVKSEGELLDALPIAVSELFLKAFGPEKTVPKAGARRPAATVAAPAAPATTTAAAPTVTGPVQPTNWLLWSGVGLTAAGAGMSAVMGPLVTNPSLGDARDAYDEYTGDDADEWDQLYEPIGFAQTMGLVGGTVTALGLGLTAYSVFGGK